VFDTLYGKKAAALYTQAGDYQKTARFYYKKAEDTYYQANNWAAYDDWRRARDQWDYFYSRESPSPLPDLSQPRSTASWGKTLGGQAARFRCFFFLLSASDVPRAANASYSVRRGVSSLLSLQVLEGP